MKANHLISVDHSALLLTKVFPDEDWNIFLAKNICGQIHQDQQIPFVTLRKLVYFNTRDLRAFAVRHGARKTSKREVNRLVDAYLDDIDLFELWESVDSLFDPSLLNKVAGIHGCKPAKADGLQLSKLGCREFLTRIDKTRDVHRDTAKALTALAFSLGEPGFPSEWTNTNVEACRQLLIHQAKQSCNAHTLLSELKKAVEGRGQSLDSMTDVILDEELELLLGDLATKEKSMRKAA